MISSLSTLSLIKKKTGSTPIASNMPIVVIGNGGTYSYAYTNDTLFSTWSYGNIGSTYANFVPRSICCGIYNSGPLWVAIGISSSVFYSSTSTNGTTWSTRSISINSIFNGSTGWIFNALNFGYASDGTTGIFMVTGYSGTSGQSQVGISLDGITWKTGGTPFTGTSFGNDCYYGNGYWVIGGNGSTIPGSLLVSSNVSYTSNTTITWASFGTDVSPYYSIYYDGVRWFYGSVFTIFFTLNKTPTSIRYRMDISALRDNTSITAGSQYTRAIATNNSNIVVCGGNGQQSWYLYRYNINTYINELTAANTNYSDRIYLSDFSSNTFYGSTVSKINYIPSSNTFIAATTGGSFEYSTNYGVTWTSVINVGTNLTNCIGLAYKAT